MNTCNLPAGSDASLSFMVQALQKVQTEEKTVLLLLTLYIRTHTMELGDLRSVPSSAQSGSNHMLMSPENAITSNRTPSGRKENKREHVAI